MLKTTRRDAAKLLGLSAVLGGASFGALAHEEVRDLRRDHVFTLGNGSAGNEVLAFGYGRDGQLALHARAATGGLGAGAGLGSQGALTLAGNGRHLFAVNPISHTVAAFEIGAEALRLVSVVDSGGLRPISVTEHEGRVVVLNADGAGNVAALRFDGDALRPVSGGVQPLSAAGGTNPAQVSFDDDGALLLVTEKGTNRLTTYRAARDGRLGAPVVTPASGSVPFGFAFDRRNNAYVSQAGASTLSSYRYAGSDALRPQAVASVPTTQAAACWVAVTPNGRFAYVVNAGSGTVSSFRIGHGGAIELAQAVAATIGTGVGAGPIDAAVSPDGRQLFVLGGRSLTISSFHIDSDGRLLDGRSIDGLPVGVIGLAAN